MSINLLRNSKVFFTTHVATAAPNIGKIFTGTGLEAPHTTSKTFEIQVLDDLSFSQTTAVETIAVNETGDAPIRGQRTFNTALNPVDFNFTTYMRPFEDSANNSITCEEKVLWNAMFGVDEIGGTDPAWTDAASVGSDPAVCVLTNSAKHQLQRFGIIVIFDQNMFLLDDCSLNTATIDFGIDAIASIQWSGQARAIRRMASPTDTAGNWTGTLVGDYTPKITDAPFLANKLSTVTLVSKIGAYGSAPDHTGVPDGGGTTYNMPLTAGSITLTNNITYLTPAYMGAINQPITYFTGSRSITGSLTAYLRTGSGGSSYSANLFTDLVTQVNSDSDPEFYLQIEIGGSTNIVRVELEMPGVVLTIPTINAESVITTTVNFTAQGTETGLGRFNILDDNEIKIKYFA